MTSHQIDLIPLSAALQKATGPLTLRGKISVNERWPLPFSLKLSP